MPENSESSSVFDKTIKRFDGYTTILTFIATLLGIVGTVIGLYATADAKVANQKAQESTDKAAALETLLKVNADERAKTDLASKYNLAAYEAVMKVIDAGQDEKSLSTTKLKEEAVLSLVTATAQGDLKTNLLEIISKSAKSEKAQQAAKDSVEFYRDVGKEASDTDKPITTSPTLTATAAGNSSNETSLNGFLVDIFHCEQDDTDHANENIANELKTTLSHSSPQVRFRVRRLLNVTNASPGYGIRSNQIRFESKSEVIPSQVLKAKLQQVDTKDAGKLNFELIQVTNQTNRYLSAFVCQS
jgi:hypothetical protein